MTDIQVASGEANSSSGDLEEPDKLIGFEDVFGDAEKQQEPKADQDKKEEKKLESEKKEDGEPEDKGKQKGEPKGEKKTKTFKFDPKRYGEMGITNEKALAEIERLEQRAFEKDQIIGRQGHKMGDLKKDLETVNKRRGELKEKVSFSDEKYNEVHLDDPAKAKRLSDEAKEAKREDKDLQNKEIELGNRQFLQDKLPNYEDLVDDIAEIIKVDLPEEITDDVISNFKKNPYLLDGTLAYNLALRSQMTKEIAGLKEENEQLKTDLKGKPKEVMKKIDSMTKSNAYNMGVDSGGSEPTSDIDMNDFFGMNASEIRKTIKKE